MYFSSFVVIAFLHRSEAVIVETYGDFTYT